MTHGLGICCQPLLVFRLAIEDDLKSRNISKHLPHPTLAMMSFPFSVYFSAVAASLACAKELRGSEKLFDISVCMFTLCFQSLSVNLPSIFKS